MTVQPGVRAARPRDLRKRVEEAIIEELYWFDSECGDTREKAWGIWRAIVRAQKELDETF